MTPPPGNRTGCSCRESLSGIVTCREALPGALAWIPGTGQGTRHRWTRQPTRPGIGARAATARGRQRHESVIGTRAATARRGIGTRAATARGQAATCPMERECPRFAAASRRPPLANASDRQGRQAETYCCRRGSGLLRYAKAFSDVCNCRQSGPLHSYISLLQGNV